jgi:hypothetical protein
MIQGPLKGVSYPKVGGLSAFPKKLDLLADPPVARPADSSAFRWWNQEKEKDTTHYEPGRYRSP